MLAGILAIALNLRPALTSLAPLLAAIQADTGLSATAAGLLTTLPVLCLGLFGALAPWLAQRLGVEPAMALALLVLAFGCSLRALAPPAGLFIGALLAGAAIGVLGVLLPALLKREYPRHAARLTGAYTLALCLGAGLAAGLTVPAVELFHLDWRGGLAIWSLPALVALLLWCPQLRKARVSRRFQPDAGAPPSRPRSLWRDRLAWRVTLFMGLQSSLAYSVFGWLPLIFESRGASAFQAGLLLSGSLAAQLLTALLGPVIATRSQDQRIAVVLFLGLTLAGLLASLFAPLSLAWPAVIILGFGQGGSFSVALVLIVLRSRDAAITGQLSGMVQSVGYTLAAAAPVTVGVLHERNGEWVTVGVLFSGIVAIALWAGLEAGRGGYVDEPPRCSTRYPR